MKQLGNVKKSVSQHHSLEAWAVYEVSDGTRAWSRQVSAVQFSTEEICIAKEFIQLVLQLCLSLIALDLTLTG